jgi:uncharacterized protein
MAHLIRNSLFVTGFLLSQALIACTAKTPTPQPGVPLPRVTLPRSEVRQLHSEATGRDYDLYIRLPDDYEKYPKVKYPVLYLLDGQWDFKLLDAIYGSLLYDGNVPDMIIVGITYSGENADYNTLRAMDYTPVYEKSVKGSGDAPKFLSFIKEQVMPLIETNYRVNPSRRILMGSSYGGTFTLFALYTEPTLFSGYVASSPVTVYGNRFAFQQDETYASSHKDLPVRLYIGVGETESLKDPVETFIDVLRKRNYKDLILETRVIEGAGHSANKIETFTRGLDFVFPDL